MQPSSAKRHRSSAGAAFSSTKQHRSSAGAAFASAKRLRSIGGATFSSAKHLRSRVGATFSSARRLRCGKSQCCRAISVARSDIFERWAALKQCLSGIPSARQRRSWPERHLRAPKRLLCGKYRCFRAPRSHEARGSWWKLRKPARNF